jgi:hypothetical protein
MNITWNGVAIHTEHTEVISTGDMSVWTVPARRKSFYKQHELAIWAIITSILFVVMVYLLQHPSILWDLSTPLINIMPGGR